MGSQPGLLAVAREKMRTRHLALRTEQAYLQWLVTGSGKPSTEPTSSAQNDRELGRPNPNPPQAEDGTHLESAR